MPESTNENTVAIQQEITSKINTYNFDLIDDTMTVKEQPEPDQRARYASDGSRFLPDSKKHPMSIEVCFEHILYDELNL